jgi:glutathione synthase/RimK-type ligase-like ATP-grasp enzyme
MKTLIVINQEDDWPFDLPGARTVSTSDYLTGTQYSQMRNVAVLNLSQPSDYQSSGYYVSMLAEARGQRPLPDVKALEDCHTPGLLVRELQSLCQDALAHVATDSFKIDCWFGQTAWAGCATLSSRLFEAFRLPLMRVHFQRLSGQWHINRVEPQHLRQLDAASRDEVGQAAAVWLGRRQAQYAQSSARSNSVRPLLAILRTPGSATMPSNPAAIEQFHAAAEELGMRAEVITRADCGRIAEFDALFIRDTTNVHDYTYRLSRQASMCGLVVMDDPDSIVRCSNKVFLHELFSRHDIPTPRTLLLHRDNLDEVLPTLGVPVILKEPDSAFSMGVTKVQCAEELRASANVLFDRSELLLAQEYLPTAFDWRIGVLANKVLFACRYHMAKGHWQVIKHEGDSRYSEGLAEAVPLTQVPAPVLELALKAAALIGDGFYGVDLKERDGNCYLIEVNDNPNVDAGNEDGVLQQVLYREVMRVMRERVALKREAAR